MDLKVGIVIAIIILIILILVYLVATDSKYVQKSYWESNYFSTPWQVYSKSNGGLDDAALLALNRANSRENPTPSDHLLSATIITRNILGHEYQPTGDNELDAENERLRQELFVAARNHHMAAVQGLAIGGGRQNGMVGRPNGAGGRPNGMGGRPNGVHPRQPRFIRVDEVPAQIIIDAATEFAFGGIIDLFLNEFAPAVDNHLANVATTRREELVADRRNIAAAVVENRGGAVGSGVQTYMDLVIQNTSDPQNAHDSGISACLKAILTRLREDQAGIELPSVDAIKQEIADHSHTLSEGRKYKTGIVNDVIERTKLHERVQKLDATDEECLRRVWARIKDPRNSAAHDKLRQAVYDALFDCYEDTLFGRDIVCVNGRVSRILSSLVLLDYDQRNWEIKKLEQFKNDIYARTHAIIKKIAKKASKSGDRGMQLAGLLYLAESADDVKKIGEVPAEDQERLAQSMREATLAMIDEYLADLDKNSGIKNAIPEFLVESTKKEALAAI
jgi:hypothetical protein